MSNDQPPPAHPLQRSDVPLRQFKARVVFETNQCADITIQSIDHIGALAKLMGAVADMPLRIVHVEFRDVTETKIIMPAGRG